MKLNVWEWKTASRWHRLRFWLFFHLGWDDDKISILPAPPRTVKVAKLRLVIIGKQAFWVYAHVYRNPFCLWYNLSWEQASVVD